MNSSYVTVYQISTDPTYASNARAAFDLGLSIFLIGLGVLTAGLILLARRVIFRRGRVPWAVMVLLSAVGGAVLWIGGLPHRHRRDEKALAAFERGDYKTVEGPVVEFDPMPFEGHKSECFTVRTTRFCYSDYMIEPGFRNTASHGGPIRAGLPVRIAYTTTVPPARPRNMILRIEVAVDHR
jgi:hypothetical protein